MAESPSDELCDELTADCNHYANGQCTTSRCMRKIISLTKPTRHEFVGCPEYRARAEIEHLRLTVRRMQTRGFSE